MQYSHMLYATVHESPASEGSYSQWLESVSMYIPLYWSNVWFKRFVCPSVWVAHVVDMESFVSKWGHSNLQNLKVNLVSLSWMMPIGGPWCCDAKLASMKKYQMYGAQQFFVSYLSPLMGTLVVSSEIIVLQGCHAICNGSKNSSFLLFDGVFLWHGTQNRQSSAMSRFAMCLFF